MRSSSSWSACPEASPKKELKCPETCTVASGAKVPENTRTRLTRPTYGSLVVFTISATNVAEGSQAMASAETWRAPRG
jgi:hypothetical protein